MISFIRLYFQNDTSVDSDQLRVDFHPRLTLGINTELKNNPIDYCVGYSWIDYILIYVYKFHYLLVTVLILVKE